MRFFSSAFLISLVLFVPSITYAQLIDISVAPTLATTPSTPRAGEETIVRVALPGTSLSTASIAWLVNGTQKAQGVGLTDFSFTAPRLGETMRIGVLVDAPGKESAATEISIRPTRVTLLWEGDTYTPSWYTGRALYSAGSMTRLHALAEFVTPSGTRIDQKTLVYTWKRNGVSMPSVSGVGKSMLVTPGPAFLQSDIIEVTVSTLDETYQGASAVRIEPRDPLLRIYEFDPLVGVHNYLSADAASSAGGDGENYIQVIPFFADATTPDDERLIYTWRLNNALVYPNESTPSRVALSADIQQATQVPLTVTLQHATHVLQRATQTFSLFLERTDARSFFGI